MTTLTRLEIGMRVQHEDGALGTVRRQVASVNGTPLYLVAWDDLSQTRTGDAVRFEEGS